MFCRRSSPVQRTTYVVVVLVAVTLNLQITRAAAQRAVASGGRRQPPTVQPQPLFDADDIDALTEEARRSGAGGSVRISQTRKKSSSRTQYIDETNHGAPANQLVPENLQIYIEVDDEQSKCLCTCDYEDVAEVAYCTMALLLGAEA